MSDHMRGVLEDLAGDYSAGYVVKIARELWPDQFDTTYTPARKTDKATSQFGADLFVTRDPRKFRAGSLKHTLLAHFRFDHDTALSAAETVGAAIGKNTETVRKRVSELARAGYLVDTGLAGNNPTGVPATVWGITTDGEQYLDLLEADAA